MGHWMLASFTNEHRIGQNDVAKAVAFCVADLTGGRFFADFILAKFGVTVNPFILKLEKEDHPFAYGFEAVEDQHFTKMILLMQRHMIINFQETTLTSETNLNFGFWLISQFMLAFDINEDVDELFTHTTEYVLLTPDGRDMFSKYVCDTFKLTIAFFEMMSTVHIAYGFEVLEDANLIKTMLLM